MIWAAVEWALLVVAIVLTCGLVAMWAMARADERREREERLQRRVRDMYRLDRAEEE